MNNATCLQAYVTCKRQTRATLYCENSFTFNKTQMKTKLLLGITTAILLFPISNFGQAPNLGTAVNFALFSTNGAVTNSGISHVTGNVGTNNGSSTGFGNVNGGMHDGDGTSATCAVDLLTAYNQLAATTATFFPAALLGNGQTLVPGVYSITGASTLNLNLNLDAQNNTNAVFIIKIQGSFSTNANSKIKLKNGAQACNVFWKVEGLVSMASGTSMKGTIIANNAAINMNTGDTLEGRAMSTAGAVTLNGVLAYTPVGCGSPLLTGPTAPTLGVAACYAVFSASGAVSNSGVTHVTGDVGSNSSSATGFNPSFVTGTIHNIPDNSTAQCATDLLNAYNYLNTLSTDIELLYPAQFGNNLVLTPHTYLLNAATVFTDTLYLDAQGNTNAVFVMKLNGALSTSTYSKVILINGAQSKNVYWKIEGAVGINNYSIFRGTIVCHNGALGALNTGVTFDGRALTTTGALTTTALTIVATALPSNCATAGIQLLDGTYQAVSIYPNPFSTSISINNISQIDKTQLKMYNVLGAEVMSVNISNQLTTFETGNLPAGIYYYKIINDIGKTIQSGKLVAQ